VHLYFALEILAKFKEIFQHAACHKIEGKCRNIKGLLLVCNRGWKSPTFLRNKFTEWRKYFKQEEIRKMHSLNDYGIQCKRFRVLKPQHYGRRVLRFRSSYKFRKCYCGKRPESRSALSFSLSLCPDSLSVPGYVYCIQCPRLDSRGWLGQARNLAWNTFSSCPLQRRGRVCTAL